MGLFNRQEMRKTLVECGVQTLEDVISIIAQDEDEQDAVFNALVFDSNAVYGRVLISLDTIKNYQNTLQESDPEDEEEKEEIQFSAAEFDYINHGEITLLDFNDMNASFSDINEGIDVFMDMVCEALLDLMETDVYKKLPKSDGFEALCMDHDAGVDGSRQRLERVKQAYKA